MQKLLAVFISMIVFLGFTPITYAPPSENPLEDKGPLTKIVFIHYKKGFNHKPQHNPGGNGSGPSCYTLLANGAKWKNVENAVVNPTNSGLDSGFLIDNTLLARETWDANTSKEVFGNTVTGDPTADWDGDAGDSPDDKNEYSFGNYSDSGVIAVTVVWGYFYGPPQTRELIEYDVLFNTNYIWGDADVSGSSVMDYLNIAVHETGHGAGLGDIYDTTCSAVTMYGYSAYGETSKRTLEQPDIKGLQKLYGA
ncbi:MAG: matrixin family metalloprotease [Candidatus Aenigmarchaeota archaeon]|nr:matrixin family metalloprotease [Candidatus Aenigmarchaeota archaeon]